MYSKFQQLQKRKEKTDLSETERIKYFTWIKENKSCVICGEFPEIHHVTNKTIEGKRRLDKRVIPLCFNHHSAQSSELSIHNDTYMFYEHRMSLSTLIEKSEEMYQEFLNETN